MAEYRYLGEPDPEWIDFPNNLPAGTIVERMSRDRLPIAQEPGLHIRNLDNRVLSPTDGKSVGLRLYRQSILSDGKSPLILYMHGGGYVTGGLETDDRLCRALARSLLITVVSVEYKLAPEFTFPAGFEDCYATIRYILSETGRNELGIDITKGWVLGGTSAGANFTAGLAHAILNNGLQPQPKGLLFMAGSFVHPDARPDALRHRILSVDEVTDAPGLTRKSIDFFAKQYGAPVTDVRYSPLLHPSRAGLCTKAFLAICGWDPRRDDSFVFADLLEQEGIIVQKKVYKGLPHGFWTTCPLLPVSQQAILDMVDAVGWLLE